VIQTIKWGNIMAGCAECQNAVVVRAEKNGVSESQLTCHYSPWTVEREIDGELRFIVVWPEVTANDICRQWLHRLSPIVDERELHA